MQPVASWADFVTLVALPGPAILDAVRLVQRDTGRPVGALLVAEMSSKGKKRNKKT
jgi:orotidine-5'-phosphate decarboxylase